MKVRSGYIEGSVGYIPLTRGQVALVDPDMVPILEQWNWHASFDRDTGGYYAGRGKGSTRTIMHRLILGLRAGDPRKGDHIDPSKTLDNRRSNLRIANNSQSIANQRLRTDNSSGYKGVTARPGNRWLAKIKVQRRTIYLGCFASPELAHAAYHKAALLHFGEFARTA